MDFKALLTEITDMYNQICTAQNPQVLKQRLQELRDQESDPANMLDISRLTQIGKQIRETEDMLDSITSLKESIDYLGECLKVFSVDEQQQFNLESEFLKIKKHAEQTFISTLYTGKWDNCDCVLDIHAGAGGEEAQDWAQMLERMYLRYALDNNLSAKVIDKLVLGAGVKSVTILVSGKHAYGNLINEKGVHRLVRISPFDANNRRHTSFASVDVSPIITEEQPITINPADLKIDTYRSGGAGGQHVNKTESAVRITHLPTGIVVQCQNERSQLQNKEFALKMLKSKLAQKQEEEREQQKQAEKQNNKKIEWGSQIRSYVLYPYNMVKDHRTGYVTSNTSAVLDGDLTPFINAMLVWKAR